MPTTTHWEIRSDGPHYHGVFEAPTPAAALVAMLTADGHDADHIDADAPYDPDDLHEIDGYRIYEADEIDSLDDLLHAMQQDDPRVMDRGDWSADEPLVARGPEPGDTEGVWGWDDSRLIVGTCAADLEIIFRDDQ